VRRRTTLLTSPSRTCSPRLRISRASPRCTSAPRSPPSEGSSYQEGFVRELYSDSSRDEPCHYTRRDPSARPPPLPRHPPPSPLRPPPCGRASDVRPPPYPVPAPAYLAPLPYPAPVAETPAPAYAAPLPFPAPMTPHPGPLTMAPLPYPVPAAEAPAPSVLAPLPSRASCPWRRPHCPRAPPLSRPHGPQEAPAPTYDYPYPYYYPGYALKATPHRHRYADVPLPRFPSTFRTKPLSRRETTPPAGASAAGVLCPTAGVL